MNISSCSLCKELGETCSECQPMVDMPPATGHAIPMWLRFHFDELELHATYMGGASVFTQMRTKVQAYFEMLRAVERGNAGRELFLTGRAAELKDRSCPNTAWRIIDSKGKRFTVYHEGLAEAIAELGLEVTPMCDVPPDGWECSRDKSHEGPCAASQVTP